MLSGVTYTSGGVSKQESTNNKDLANITWAHAVNNKDYLENVLRGNVDFIEADILLGYLENDHQQQRIPIMAHPPATQSNLSLEQFLMKCFHFNRHAESTQLKGIKLDFKSIEALESSIDIIEKFYDSSSFPTWINADILAGPVNNTSTIPVDPYRFFNCTKRLGPVVLSIGWTTKWDQNSVEGTYSKSNIQHMIQTIKANKIDIIGTPITFPIRAGIAANSLSQLKELYEYLRPTNEITFTIWSSVHDAVDVDKLRHLIITLGTNLLYIDVPDELKEKLNLHKATK